MKIDKSQLEVLEHFTNAVAKSFEIWQLKQALMSGLIGNEEVSMARKEEMTKEVREDLEEARLDLWDMLMETMRTFNQMGKKDLLLENIANEGALNENPMLDALSKEGDLTDVVEENSDDTERSEASD